ncbi:MAG: hypothetical protein LBK65_08870 [Tannerellaceae bacterium]|jgi:hypothetical protein|nr:hypothetical protein [Tannerellaceae bacterium]
MKKLFITLLTAICLLSCEGPAGPMGPAAEQTQWKYVYYTVEDRHWNLVGQIGDLNSFYEFSFEEPSLTDFIYSEGVVMGYAVDNPQTRDEILRPLPDTWPVGEDTNLWTESVTFAYKPGLVTFYVGYSDFATNVRPPTMTFKIMMIW